MSPKKKVVAIHFTISIIIIILFVSAGIYVKDNVLKPFDEAEVEEEIAEEPEKTKDVSRDLGIAIFKLMATLAILLFSIWTIYQITTRMGRRL